MERLNLCLYGQINAFGLVPNLTIVVADFATW